MTRRSAWGCRIVGDHRLHFALSERYDASREAMRDSSRVRPVPCLTNTPLSVATATGCGPDGVTEPVRRGLVQYGGLVQYVCVQSIEIELTEEVPAPGVGSNLANHLASSLSHSRGPRPRTIASCR